MKQGSKISSLLISNDFPPIVSGISTVFYNIWKLLPDNQWLVLAPKVRGSEDFDRNSGVRAARYPYIIRTGLLPKLLNQIMLFLYTTYLIISRRINKLHCGLLLSSGSIGWFYKKIFCISYDLWVYGDETKDIYRGSVVSKFITDTIIRNADKIITNSPYVTREFIDFGIDKEKIIEIVPAVNAEIFSPAGKPENLVEKYDLRGKKILLTVSRLAKRKGHENVLYAIKEVIRKFPNISYVIVGKGTEEVNLRSIADRLGIKEHIVFAGFIPDNDLPDFYNLCDIFVMPNIEVYDSTDSIEGFGIVFIEANACGKPVIGGRSGGVVDGAIIDGVNGLLVDPANINEIGEKIILLLRDEELSKRLGAAGRARVEKDFQWIERADVIRNL